MNEQLKEKIEAAVGNAATGNAAVSAADKSGRDARDPLCKDRMFGKEEG